MTDNVFDHLNGPVVGEDDPDVADRTTDINVANSIVLNPSFNLEDPNHIICNDGDSSNPHLYLCVDVKKSASSSVDFTLNDNVHTTCIEIECQGKSKENCRPQYSS